MEQNKLKQIIEAALLAAGGALKMERLLALFEGDDELPGQDDILKALHELMEECNGRGIELVEVNSGFRYQARAEFSPWVQRLWEEKPQRYSRALLETLALIAYRQPITRAEIEEVRGVSVSSTIIKTLQEREWVRVVGHRDVPGKPAMYATTRGFLDYFNLQSLDELPTLAEIRDIDNINAELAFEEAAGEQEEAGQEAISEPETEAALATEDEVGVEETLAETEPAEEADVASEVVSLAEEEEEAGMSGLSDEEMAAIDALNRSFRENLHGRREETEEAETEEGDEPTAESVEDEAPESDEASTSLEHESNP